MGYWSELTLTRSAPRRLDPGAAPTLLGLHPQAEIFLPGKFAQLRGEPCARTLFNAWGHAIGITDDRLCFLDRWTPQPSVQYYVRGSRTTGAAGHRGGHQAGAPTIP